MRPAVRREDYERTVEEARRRGDEYYYTTTTTSSSTNPALNPVPTTAASSAGPPCYLGSSAAEYGEGAGSLNRKAVVGHLRSSSSDSSSGPPLVPWPGDLIRPQPQQQPQGRHSGAGAANRDERNPYPNDPHRYYHHYPTDDSAPTGGRDRGGLMARVPRSPLSFSSSGGNSSLLRSPDDQDEDEVMGLSPIRRSRHPAGHSAAEVEVLQVVREEEEGHDGRRRPGRSGAAAPDKGKGVPPLGTACLWTSDADQMLTARRYERLQAPLTSHSEADGIKKRAMSTRSKDHDGLHHQDAKPAAGIGLGVGSASRRTLSHRPPAAARRHSPSPGRAGVGSAATVTATSATAPAPAPGGPRQTSMPFWLKRDAAAAPTACSPVTLSTPPPSSSAAAASSRTNKAHRTASTRAPRLSPSALSAATGMKKKNSATGQPSNDGNNDGNNNNNNIEAAPCVITGKGIIRRTRSDSHNNIRSAQKAPSSPPQTRRAPNGTTPITITATATNGEAATAVDRTPPRAIDIVVDIEDTSYLSFSAAAEEEEEQGPEQQKENNSDKLHHSPAVVRVVEVGASATNRSNRKTTTTAAAAAAAASSSAPSRRAPALTTTSDPAGQAKRNKTTTTRTAAQPHPQTSASHKTMEHAGQSRGEVAMEAIEEEVEWEEQGAAAGGLLPPPQFASHRFISFATEEMRAMRKRDAREGPTASTSEQEQERGADGVGRDGIGGGGGDDGYPRMMTMGMMMHSTDAQPPSQGPPSSLYPQGQGGTFLPSSSTAPSSPLPLWWRRAEPVQLEVRRGGRLLPSSAMRPRTQSSSRRGHRATSQPRTAAVVVAATTSTSADPAAVSSSTAASSREKLCLAAPVEEKVDVNDDPAAEEAVAEMKRYLVEGCRALRRRCLHRWSFQHHRSVPAGYHHHNSVSNRHNTKADDDLTYDSAEDAAAAAAATAAWPANFSTVPAFHRANLGHELDNGWSHAKERHNRVLSGIEEVKQEIAAAPATPALTMIANPPRGAATGTTNGGPADGAIAEAVALLQQIKLRQRSSSRTASPFTNVQENLPSHSHAFSSSPRSPSPGSIKPSHTIRDSTASVPNPPTGGSVDHLAGMDSCAAAGAVNLSLGVPPSAASYPAAGPTTTSATAVTDEWALYLERQAVEEEERQRAAARSAAVLLNALSSGAVNYTNQTTPTTTNSTSAAVYGKPLASHHHHHSNKLSCASTPSLLKGLAATTTTTTTTTALMMDTGEGHNGGNNAGQHVVSPAACGMTGISSPPSTSLSAVAAVRMPPGQPMFSLRHWDPNRPHPQATADPLPDSTSSSSSPAPSPLSTVKLRDTPTPTPHGQTTTSPSTSPPALTTASSYSSIGTAGGLGGGLGSGYPPSLGIGSTSVRGVSSSSISGGVGRGAPVRPLSSSTTSTAAVPEGLLKHQHYHYDHYSSLQPEGEEPPLTTMTAPSGIPAPYSFSSSAYHLPASST